MQSTLVNYLLSCDWGTTTCRLKLVEKATFNILAEESSEEGIKNTWFLWQENGAGPDREEFYFSVIRRHINKIQQKTGLDLSGVPLALSGMASSSIGIVNVSYASLPFQLDGSGAIVKIIRPRANFNHPVFLISGVKSDHDLMRGEETQLIGCQDEQQQFSGKKLFIFPGTHSKHIICIDQQMIDIKTYMTGELFQLLAEHSILNSSISRNRNIQDPACKESFLHGLKDATNAHLLANLFKVRTNQIFEKLSLDQNYFYLSGLLIGAEWREISKAEVDQIFLCCPSNLSAFYQIACEASDFAEKVHIFPSLWMEGAVVRGQLKVLEKYLTDNG